MWKVSYTKIDGTRTTKRGFKTKTEAREWERTHASTHTQKTINGKLPLQAYEDAYLQEIVYLRPSTKDIYTIALYKHVLPAWGKRIPASISPLEVQRWVNQTAASRSTIDRNVRVLGRLCELAGVDNPCKQVRKPAKSQRLHTYLTADQVKLLAAHSPYPSAIYTLATVGLRWGELAGLQVRDFKPATGQLHIQRSITIVRGNPIIGPTKSGKPRIVSAPQFVCDMLTEETKSKPGSDYIWSIGGRYLIRPKGTKSWFASSVRKCQQIDNTFPTHLRLHDLRHTAASLMVASGAHVKIVQAQLGHATASMTLDTYADLFPEDLTQIADRMNETFGM